MKRDFAYGRSFNFFNRRTKRREYERMRRIARFWRVYDAPPDHWPPAFYSEFWNWFRPAAPYPAEPLAVRLNEYSANKDIPY